MKSKDKISWTDDRIALLKRMWKEGKSAAEIAKAVGKGVTRNAVIGKAHRMGLSGRPSPIKKPESTSSAAPKKAAAASALPVGRSKEQPKAIAKKPGAAPAVAPQQGFKSPAPLRTAEDVRKFEKEEVPPGGGVPLIDLTERMCKWPIGDPRDADFIFCGLAIRPGTPYCPQHAATAYQTSSRRGAHHHHHPAAVAVVANEDKGDEEEVVVEEEEEEEEVETAV
jgi:GcrA cell cycle regulator